MHGFLIDWVKNYIGIKHNVSQKRMISFTVLQCSLCYSFWESFRTKICLQSVQRVKTRNPETVNSSNLPLERLCITAAWALLDHPYSLTSQHQRVHISSWKTTHTHTQSGSRPVFLISLLHFCKGKNGSAHCSLALWGNAVPAHCFLSQPYTAAPCVFKPMCVRVYIVCWIFLYICLRCACLCWL